SGIKGFFAKLVLHYIRIWDTLTANRVDHFVSNSNYIARRIKRTYNRNATTIYPPVDVEKFQLMQEKEDYYITASRLVPYKRIDLIVNAFSQMPDKKLLVIGEGPDLEKIRARAGANVQVLGYQSVSKLKDYLQRAKAFVFAADEDFGIAPVEAQACGTPVIAFAKGGILETVVDGVTGILYPHQSEQSLKEAVLKFEAIQSQFDPHIIRQHAERFSTANFKNRIRAFVLAKYEEFYQIRDTGKKVISV
ncbi:MAG: glycosyltransferase, partial [Hymenobacteraceae bacterium]|nr:glycosyltransferase [Hymenobacteraceae bacterium]